MMNVKKIPVFIYVLLLVSQVLFCSQNEKILRVNAIGKSSLKITPKSKARAMALRAAKIEGYRELARAAGLERISRENNFEERKIDAFMKGAQVVEKRFISDHEVEITMEIEKAKIIDMASDLKKQLNATLAQLKEKIRYLEEKMIKIRMELEELKNILDKLEDKS
ncbi:MAG: hypothetical protein GTO20_05375 [Candidatus Aminicenantes bacterium]|nr:hypothetical protein [Candidatus Aminicenantes bacterium]